MISQRKLGANRRNAKKSTGPRTTVGKRNASRNALRHGLNAIRFCEQPVDQKVMQIAKMICADETDSLCFDQAHIIAESCLLLARVRLIRAQIIGNRSTQDAL